MTNKEHSSHETPRFLKKQVEHKLEEKIRYLKKEFSANGLTSVIKIDFKILGKKKKHGPGLEPGTFGFKSQHTTTAPLAHLFIDVYI